jgi:hypothetical protein
MIWDKKIHAIAISGVEKGLLGHYLGISHQDNFLASRGLCSTASATDEIMNLEKYLLQFKNEIPPYFFY